jgi:hypothetical protein
VEVSGREAHRAPNDEIFAAIQLDDEEPQQRQTWDTCQQTEAPLLVLYGLTEEESTIVEESSN